MRLNIPAALLILFMPFSSQGAEGMINVQSEFGPIETADRLEGVLKSKGMTIFKRLKHSAGAAKVGVKLRHTELIIFGNPKVGSPLMACQQTVAIDLPQKALIWQDESEKVWITYNSPAYLEKRHKIVGCDKVLGKVAKALAGLTRAAAKR